MRWARTRIRQHPWAPKHIVAEEQDAPAIPDDVGQPDDKARAAYAATFEISIGDWPKYRKRGRPLGKRVAEIARGVSTTPGRDASAHPPLPVPPRD